MCITHAVYVSSATRVLADTALLTLVDEARQRNERQGITGLLVHFAGNYVQAVEGEPDRVNRLLRRIAADPRHTDFQVILSLDSKEREYPDWSMGLERVPAALVDRTPIVELARSVHVSADWKRNKPCRLLMRRLIRANLR